MSLTKHLIFSFCVLFIISGCSTLSTISSTQPNVTIRIMEKQSANAPVKEDLSVTTFSSYHFMIEKPGSNPLYGVLPLHVNLGHIIMDALFFAPLVLVNARGAYPFYQVDYDKNLIRYSEDADTWYDYYIQAEEITFAKAFYDKLDKEQSKGKVQLNSGEFTAAIDTFTKIIWDYPNDSLSYRLRGNAYDNVGDRQKAVSDWEQAAKLGDTKVQDYLNHLNDQKPRQNAN